MMTFTNKKIFARGICMAQAADPVTGEVIWSSDKFQQGNINFAANTDPLRAGLGNGIATIIATDSDTTVNFTRADFDLMCKMAAVGGTVSYNAVSPVCQTVTASGTALKVDVSQHVPTAQYGYNKAFCFVQEVGEASSYEIDGVPYGISEDGTISGFTAVAGKQYKVWYFAKKASAQVGVVKSMFNGKIVHFTAQVALYQNVSGKNKGTRWGWAYIIVPRLYLNPEGANTTGDQNNYDTTNVTGRAINEDAEVVSATCDDCGGGSTVAYMVIVPDEESDEVMGLAVIGGVVSAKVSTKVQVPAQFVMKNGQLVAPSPYSLCKYELSDAPTGTTVDTNGVLSAGSTAGDCTMQISYPAEGDVKATTQIAVSIVSE